MNYFGLIRNFTLGGASVNLSAGNSINSTVGIGGILIYNKNLNKTTVDVDVNDDGRVTASDLNALAQSYNNVSTDSDFISAYDINKDNKINIIDIARVGFEWNTR